MRILHIVPFGIPGAVGSGAYSRFYSIAKPLQSKVEEYSIFTIPPLDPVQEKRLKATDWDGFRIIGSAAVDSVSISRPYGTLRSLLGVTRKLDQVIADLAPSLILAHNVSIFVGLPTLIEEHRRDVPVVVDYMDVGHAFLKRTLVARSIEGLACKQATMVIAISTFLAERARRFGSKEVLHIPPLVDTTRFRPSKPDEQLRERLGLSQAFVLVFVGYSWHLKGVDILLRALSLLVPEFPELVLLLIGGDDAERTEFSLMAERLGLQRKVLMTGPIEYREIPRFLDLADAAIIPFKDDVVNQAAGPTKAAEYLACGKPVVATRVGDLPRLIEHGTTGLIADPNPEGIAQSIQQLISDPGCVEAMGKNSRRFAQRYLDMWIRSDELLNRFTRIVGEI